MIAGPHPRCGTASPGQLGRSAADAIANAATRSAVDGSNFGDNIRAAIPDVIGNALGSVAGTAGVRRLIQTTAAVTRTPRTAVLGESAMVGPVIRMADADGAVPTFEDPRSLGEIMASIDALAAGLPSPEMLYNLEMAVGSDVMPDLTPAFIRRAQASLSAFGDDLATSNWTEGGQGLFDIGMRGIGAAIREWAYPQQAGADMVNRILTAPSDLLMASVAGSNSLGYWLTGDSFNADISLGLASDYYQGAINEGYTLAASREAQGLIRGLPNTRVGDFVDRFARDRMNGFARFEGLGDDILRINRRLYDPAGSGAFRIPDVHVVPNSRIFDATVGQKLPTSPQIVDFGTFANGRVTVLTPDQLSSRYSFSVPGK